MGRSRIPGPSGTSFAPSTSKYSLTPPTETRTAPVWPTGYTPGGPVSTRNWSEMFDKVQVVGAGRVGSALSARLAERGVALGGDRPDLVLVCVPDRAIAEVAASVARGPWVAHVSGATPLAALEPHGRRWPPPAADVHQGARRGAARRRVRGSHRRERGRPRCRLRARPAARAQRVRARRLAARPLPRERRDRIELPGHAATRRRAAARARGGAARSARPAHAAHDRERLRADRPDLPRRLGDGRRARAGDRGRGPRPAARLPRAGTDDGAARARRGPVHRDPTVADTRDVLRRRGGVGLVPTMGALHDGHRRCCAPLAPSATRSSPASS